MAGTKRPRKAYKPRGAFVPMMRCTRNDLALELRLAIELLIAEPSPDAYNQLSKMLLAMGNTGARGESLARANNTMLAICDRFDRVGKVGVSVAEATSLRCAAGGLDEMLSHIPINVFSAAVAVVSIQCQELGV
ncbi:hypothetical protein SAMN04515619_12015 [Collimonas sp. OK412]|nr:hypothetical protein SAMN04515619_12015 [Collimonas sp. OK412]